ncbi:hypothetical protein Tco_0883688 [Tanacetum coccineum]
MPPTLDLSFTCLDEFVNEPVVENYKAMSSEEEPKVVRKYDDAPSIEEWVLDDEEEDVSQPKTEKKIARPSIVKKEVNHQNFAKKTHPYAKKNLVSRAVLMKSGLVSINTTRQNISKIAVLVNTVRQVNAAYSNTTVNAARPMSYLSKTTHLTVKRPIHKNNKFKHASKSLNKLIECQIVDNCKKGLGYENYNVVPPPYTGNFMPPTPDLSFTGLDEFVNEPVVENCKAMSSEEEPKVVRKYDDAPSIEEWVSDDEEEDVSQPKTEKKTVRPIIVKKEFVKSKQQEKTARKTVKLLV